MRYISCFSGIGGLEAKTAPIAICEIDTACRKVLAKRFPNSICHDDIETFSPPRAEVVTGGWPCQDISVAGDQIGLSGTRSGLFYELVRVAKEAKADTIVAENVPNLLRLNKGKDFLKTLDSFKGSGYKYVSWRTLNARQFGLPHERRRIFIIASKHRELALSIHRNVKNLEGSKSPGVKAAGFYWTAGIQSICYSLGYTPTLKIGSGLSIPSPPAVHYNNVVRKLSPFETLVLQGFTTNNFKDIKPADIYTMSGNAVAVPVGRFVMDGVQNGKAPDSIKFNYQHGLFNDNLKMETKIPNSGVYEENAINPVSHPKAKLLANNLYSFLDLKSSDILSQRAANGLLKRLSRSGKKCPESLRLCLEKIVG